MSDVSLAFYRAIKQSSRCMVCGSVEHLQMHHILPAHKVSEIIKIAKTGDLPATVAELQKTIPVCEFDHKRIHKGQLRGWLDGHFDNSKPSTAEYAYQYSPYLNWLARKRPEVMLQFYRDYIEKNHRALWPIFNSAGIALPPSLRLRVVTDDVRTIVASEQNNRAFQVLPFPHTNARHPMATSSDQKAGMADTGPDTPPAL
jgi:hypothetical protein